MKDLQKCLFFAIGIGGNGNFPKDIYVVPLRDLHKSFIPYNELKRYYKKSDRNFLFDSEKMVLK